MLALTFIWWTALVLAAASLGAMALLIALRLRRGRREAEGAAERAAIVAGFMSLLQDGPSAAGALDPHLRRGGLIAEALLEFLALVRGQDRDRLLAGLAALGVDRVLVARLRSGTRAGRLACIEALAVFPGVRAAAALRPACRSGDPQIRLAAWRALVEMGAEISIERLLDELARRELHASSALADLLKALTSRRPAESLAAALRDDLPPLVRAMLVEGLGAAGDYAAVTGLMDCTRDPHPEVRAAAAGALGRLMHPAAEPALGRALADPDWQVRGAAAEAAGHAGFFGLADALAGRLDDPIWWVRFQAAAALARLGPAGRERLASAAAGAGAEARRAAALTLAERRAA